MTSPNGRKDIAHIAGKPRDAQQDRFMISAVRRFSWRRDALPHEKVRIHRARARSHHQTVFRSEAHRGIDTVAVLHSRQGAPVPHEDIHGPLDATLDYQEPKQEKGVWRRESYKESCFWIFLDVSEVVWKGT